MSSPTNVVHLPQNRLEKILREDLLAAAGALPDGIRSDFFKGYDAHSFSSSDSGVSFSITKNTSISDPAGDATAGDVNKRTVSMQCDYLIGADGAHSLVRRELGIPMQGRAALQHLVNVHFTCPGLFHQLQPRPAMLYFVFNEVSALPHCS